MKIFASFVAKTVTLPTIKPITNNHTKYQSNDERHNPQHADQDQRRDSFLNNSYPESNSWWGLILIWFRKIFEKLVNTRSFQTPEKAFEAYKSSVLLIPATNLDQCLQTSWEQKYFVIFYSDDIRENKCITNVNITAKAFWDTIMVLKLLIVCVCHTTGHKRLPW